MTKRVDLLIRNGQRGSFETRKRLSRVRRSLEGSSPQRRPLWSTFQLDKAREASNKLRGESFQRPSIKMCTGDSRGRRLLVGDFRQPRLFKTGLWHFPASRFEKRRTHKPCSTPSPRHKTCRLTLTCLLNNPPRKNALLVNRRSFNGKQIAWKPLLSAHMLITRFSSPRLASPGLWALDPTGAIPGRMLPSSQKGSSTQKYCPTHRTFCHLLKAHREQRRFRSRTFRGTRPVPRIPRAARPAFRPGRLTLTHSQPTSRACSETRSRLD